MSQSGMGTEILNFLVQTEMLQYYQVKYCTFFYI